MKEERAKFLKIYSQLPESLIEQIVVIVDGKPYSWKSIYFEVKNNTIREYAAGSFFSHLIGYQRKTGENN